MRKLLPLIALVVAGCATAPAQPALVKSTSSGLAEGTFHQSTIAAVQQKFAAMCLGLGRTVEDINALQISCGTDELGLRAETWHVTTTWTLIQTGADVHATAQAYVAYPGGPKSPLTGRNDITNKMQATMARLGAD